MTAKKTRYTAVVDGWRFTAIVSEGVIRIYSNMPEQFDLVFSSTGCKGGNHSHGGRATLELINYAGDCTVLKDKFCSFKSVSLVAKGDIELSGLTAILYLLGQIMEAERCCKVSYLSMDDEGEAE